MKNRSHLMPRLMAALALALAPALYAAPLDNRIPGDALLYVGWQGADALAPEYAASNLKSVLDTSTLPAFLEQQLPHWIELAGQKNPDAPAQITDAKAGLTILWRHPVAVYVGPADFSNPQQPKPRVAVLCDAGADAPALLALLQKTIAQAGSVPISISATQKDGLVILVVGSVAPEQFAVHADALSAAPAYVQAMKHVRSGGAITAFADPRAFLSMIDDALGKDATVPAGARQKYEAVIDGLGLKALAQFAYSGGFDGKGWSEEGFLGAPAPRTGLLALADQGPVSDAALAAVPENAVAFSASKADLSGLPALARDIAGRVDPGAVAKINEGLAQVNQQIGFDIEKDFFATLGDEWVMYRFPSPDGIGIASAFAHKLKDPTTFAKTLTVIEGLINAKGGGRIQVESTDADGISVSAVETPVFSVAWTVRNGYFYVSSLAGISAVVNQVEKHQPSITGNAAYQAARAALPQVAASSIEYSDPAKIYPEIYRTMGTVLPLLRTAGIAVPITILPNPAKAEPYMTPGATISWTDAEGAHFSSKSAFPGAAAIGGQQSGSSAVAVAAMGTAILLPSLGKARELANRSYDAANARALAQSCNVWAADHNDHLPDHLGRLILDNYVAPKQLVSKRAGTQPLALTADQLAKAKTDFASFAALVDQHCDFVYLGEGLTNTTDSSIVLLFEKPNRNSRDGINVGFEDGHAEFIRFPGLADVFTATNNMLKKNGKPEVDVDALLAAAPGLH